MIVAQERDLQVSRRYVQFNAAHSIRDLYDLLVELVTNSDDSYRELFVDGQIPEDGGLILIAVARHKTRPSVVTVADRARGIRDLESKLQRIGDRTSREGDRGFMARGLRDCAALGRVTVESICDGSYMRAAITPEFKYVSYGSGSKPSRASTEDRKRLGLKRNGTVVSVELQPSVSLPLLPTIVRDVPWHFALRDIAREGGPGRLLVRDSGSGQSAQAVFVSPTGDLVHDKEFEVPGYPHRARFQLWKSRQALEDPTDKRFRKTGVLVKGKRAIFECSFLKSALEGDPAAELYFGRLECPGIDTIAAEWDERRRSSRPHPRENPVLVIDPNRRDGLNRAHPFTTALFDYPVRILREEFARDKETRRRDAREVASRETRDRLRRLAREAGRFMRDKMEDLGTPLEPGESINEAVFAEQGIVLVPSFTQMTAGQEKTFYVRVNQELDLPIGTEVKPFLGTGAWKNVEIVGPRSHLDVDPVSANLLRGSFRVRAIHAIP